MLQALISWVCAIENLVELDVVRILGVLVILVLSDESGIEILVADAGVRRGMVGLMGGRDEVIVVVDVDAVDVLLDWLLEVLFLLDLLLFGLSLLTQVS